MKGFLRRILMGIAAVTLLSNAAAFAQDRHNPTFMAIYLPGPHATIDRNARLVASAENAINGVFTRRGFKVIDRAVIEKIYSKLPQSGTGVEDLAELAANSKADMLLIYDLQVEIHAGSRKRAFDNLWINLATRAVNLISVQLIAQKSCDNVSKIIKRPGSHLDDIGAARAADEIGKCVADKLVDDVITAYINHGFSFER